MGDPFEAELDERLLEENAPARLALEDELRSLIYEKASEMSVMHPANSNVWPSKTASDVNINSINVTRARWESREVVVEFEVSAALEVDYEVEHEGKVLNEGSDATTFLGTARATVLAFRDVTLDDWELTPIEDHTDMPD